MRISVHKRIIREEANGIDIHERYVSKKHHEILKKFNQTPNENRAKRYIKKWSNKMNPPREICCENDQNTEGLIQEPNRETSELRHIKKMIEKVCMILQDEMISGKTIDFLLYYDEASSS